MDAQATERTAVRSRARIVALAIAVAVLGWTVAPADWPAGPGTMRVVVDDTLVVAADVMVGSTDPVMARSGGAVLELPGGVPVEGKLTAVATSPAGQPTIELTLSDGRRERIPVLSYDETSGVAEASRRPPVNAEVILGLLGLVVVLWVSEVIPLWATSMLIPIVAVATGLGAADDALAPFFHPIIALFFAGFLMAEAMQKVGLDRLAAVSLVSALGRSPAVLLVGMMTVSAFLSMWMSNTAAAAVMIPVALAVTAPIHHPGYRRGAVLGVAYAATLGGVGSAIGTPANPLAIEFLESFAGEEISFVGWFGFGLPMVVVMLPVMAAYLWWRMDVSIGPHEFAEVRRSARSELHTVGRLNSRQTVVLTVFALVMLGWLTEVWHGVDTGIVALAGAIALATLGRVDSDDLGRISWSALLTFGGGLAMGLFLTETGTSDWLATRMAGLGAVPSGLGVGIVAAATLALTTVASNTATAAMMIPLAIPLAAILGVDPMLLVVVVAIASSIDFALVIGTPPTMIAYSTKLYTTREIFRTGIVLDLLGVGLLVTAVSWIWTWLGVV